MPRLTERYCGVVQLCAANYAVTGASFPCLAVDTGRGSNRGDVILRAPNDKTQVLVVPIAKTEAVKGAMHSWKEPNFFQDAWRARKYVIAAAHHRLADHDIGLALNARPMRSQDQLHIHVDCVAQVTTNQLRRHDDEVYPGQWSKLRFPLMGRYYWAMRLSSDLGRNDVVALAADLFELSPGAFESIGLAVIPRLVEKEPLGFYLLADQYIPHRDPNGGYGEALLDHTCSADGEEAGVRTR